MKFTMTPHALNTTIQNRTKQPRLGAEHIAPTHTMKNKMVVLRFLEALLQIEAPKASILFHLGKKMLGPSENLAVLSFISEHDCPAVEVPAIPANEYDLLGTAYQFLNSKFENLERGSFYTGPDVANDLVSDLSFSDGETIIDPACGSGVLLFQSGAGPEQITGIDNDPIAIMLAKFNYFLKFPDAPAPRLYTSDFFAWHSANARKRFTYVVGNPPYGANVDLTHSRSANVTTGESFSHFVECGYELLSESGTLRFLVPEALLNVKRHQDIRDFILKNTNLVLLKSYKAAFAGVMSDIYRMDIDRQDTPNVRFISTSETAIPKAAFLCLKNHIFSNLSSVDIEIIEKVRAICPHDLAGSTYGLGVVTGDNGSKLLTRQIPGSEPIYTGKEVEKYNLMPAQNFLVFERNNLQQVAPDWIYRASEKLVYKTISKRLKVAIDRTGSLTSNSANIILPFAPNNTIESIASLLNSDLYSFLNIKMFGGVNKVARENLEHLPIPDFRDEQLRHFEALVQAFSGDDTPLQDYVHREVFQLSVAEIAYIQRTVYGSEKRPLLAGEQETALFARQSPGRGLRDVPVATADLARPQARLVLDAGRQPPHFQPTRQTKIGEILSILRLLLSQRGQMTCAEVQVRCGVNATTARMLLKTLISLGCVQAHGKKRGTIYFWSVDSATGAALDRRGRDCLVPQADAVIVMAANETVVPTPRQPWLF